MVQAWVEVQTVLDITGVQVTEQQLAQAQADIEVMCGRHYGDTARLRVRDLYWLGRAVAYQSAWAPGQYDLRTRMDVIRTDQDGVRTDLKDDAAILAPFAARAINRLSWRRSRTMHVRSPFLDGGTYGTNPLAESSDRLQPWVPYGGAS